MATIAIIKTPTVIRGKTAGRFQCEKLRGQFSLRRTSCTALRDRVGDWLFLAMAMEISSV
jgi:hypothetical protein